MKSPCAHILLSVLLLTSSLISAQIVGVDTSFLFKEARITAPRLAEHQIGLSTTNFDSAQKLAYQHRNLSDLLSDESPVFMKSYGLGSLATTAFRGGSANHTAVLWNGISISSPMSGQMDLSLVPMLAADDIFIQHGAGSALFGSGALAGVIQLVNKTKFNQGLSARANLSFGSFSDCRQNIAVEISKKKWVSSLKIFNAQAQNNFPFNPAFEQNTTRRRQSNGALMNRGLINENKWLLGRYHTLSLNAWLQTTNRNLPPTLLQERSLASQTDDAIRLHTEWSFAKEKLKTFVRTAWLNEQLIYEDPLAGTMSRSRTNQFISEAEATYELHPLHDLNIGLHHTFAQASNESYETNPSQNRFAFFGAHQYHSKNRKWHSRLAFRMENVDAQWVPATFSVGNDYQLFEWLEAKASISKVYRIPSLNDLYWRPGGNPDLQAESGYAYETGAHIAFKRGRVSFNSQLSLFSRNIHNWILWLPEVNFWSPQNIMQVWSRGTESRSALSFRQKDWCFTLDLLTNYVLSENQIAKLPNDASVGRQLIYTPMYSGMAKLSVSYNRVFLSYRHNYVGYRYTSSDNSQYLPPFDLGALQTSWRFKQKKYSGRLFFEINNLWNEQYQILSNRPMPGINFQGGVSIQFKQLTSSTNHQ